VFYFACNEIISKLFQDNFRGLLQLTYEYFPTCSILLTLFWNNFSDPPLRNTPTSTDFRL